MLGTALSVARATRARPAEQKPVVVAGAKELAALLAKELRAGGDASAVRVGGPAAGAAVLVWLGKPDLDALRAATRARVPIVGVTDGESLPYVLDTDLVVVKPGEPLPVDRVARAIAGALPDGLEQVAAQLPGLREACVGELIRRQARRNAIAAASVDRARAAGVLTFAQLRLALGIASAYGSRRTGGRRLAGNLASVPLIRALSRRLGERLPARRFVRAALAYGMTHAVGQVARWSVRSRS